MALIRALSGSSGGGGQSVTSLEADTTQSLGSITTASGSYTATEDCIMIGTVKSSVSYVAQIYINGNSNVLFQTYNTSDYDLLGKDSYGFFIPKGSVISTRSSGTYNLNFYKLK